ncbi:hypothetical protein [Sphingomonas crusticola]|uniref:hypothetical protein n=1 Tax=Sphingomonas crusticola TaxID=1697973 RepID=UPI000E25193F|nr:hypothetical protein [Sphingomonas crusticola]
MLQQPVLAAIRAALCDRIDEAAVAAQRQARPNVSMPSALLAAGLYLAAAGLDEEPSAGEQYFAWGPRAYRRYLDRLSPIARAAELEAGRRVIFHGRGSRPPLVSRGNVDAADSRYDAA